MCDQMYGFNERGGDDGDGDQKRLMTNKANCTCSIHSDFPSLGKIDVTDINQDEKAKHSQPKEKEDSEVRRIKTPSMLRILQ